VVYAPGTVQQCYDVTRRAIAVAHKYQVPAIILTDQFLQDAEMNIPPLDDSYRPIDRCLVADAGADYRRYEPTDSGVSPRAIPGGEARVICDSDEHTADGHITEDLRVHLDQQHKRLAKRAGLIAEILGPDLLGPADAATLLICWGSSLGPCLEAAEILGEQGAPTAVLHFPQVWPIDAETVRERIGRRERVICVEGNADAQLLGLLRQVRAMDECETILRYDGLPLTARELARKVNE
jgi:2-oxoglutarate ferredoxin oxidoreductase subunit alpha